MRRGAVIIAASALLAGCAVGPDFIKPAPPKAAGYGPGAAQTASANIAGGGAQRLARGRDIPGEWWNLFHSAALKSLIAQALTNNPDLAAAQAALRVARENAAVQRGVFYPQVDANFTATRQKLAADITGMPPDPAIFNTFTGQVNVSYAPDVFGANWRAVESLDAQAEAQRLQLEAIYLTLTSNIVLAAVQEASLRGQIAATEKIITIAKDLLDLLRRQRELGQIPEADVVAQEAAVAQIEQTLPPLQRQLEQQRHLLIALTGRLPNERMSEAFWLASFRLPQTLPVSLPSRLVQQRPDIRVAEANLHAASAQVGVAVANRLPNIALSANLGSTAFDVSKLFSPDTGFWTIAGSVTQPVFHGFSLLHREFSTRAAFDQAKAQYRSTVVLAFQNVADALSAVRTDAIALQKAVVAEQAAERSLNIARERLKLGDITYLQVLNAQQTYQQALINRVQAQANRFADTAALFQALGGGWWNRNDIWPDKEYPYFGVFN